MKTLVIISHPNPEDSATQAFLSASSADLKTITKRELNSQATPISLDVKGEQDLLQKNNRIIFQFPLYWFSSPASLKKYEDEVLTREFAYQSEGGNLKGKELGIVVSTGYPKTAFAAGAAEGFSISQIMIPFEALARQCGMRFITPLTIDQFAYKTDEEKAQLLIDYQMYLTAPFPLSFDEKAKWLANQLKVFPNSELIRSEILKNQDNLNDLKKQLSLIKNDEDK